VLELIENTGDFCVAGSSRSELAEARAYGSTPRPRRTPNSAGCEPPQPHFELLADKRLTIGRSSRGAAPRFERTDHNRFLHQPLSWPDSRRCSESHSTCPKAHSRRCACRRTSSRMRPTHRANMNSRDMALTIGGTHNLQSPSSHHPVGRLSSERQEPAIPAAIDWDPLRAYDSWRLPDC
jgi:hypothetical protein